MKHLIFLFCSVGVTCCFSQEEKETVKQESLPYKIAGTDTIYERTDVSAIFPGGKPALDSYLKKNLIYPNEGIENEAEGLCYVKFIIDENGKVANVWVNRSIIDCTDCGKEAIRLVNNMPDWIPAKSGGKAVKSYYNLKITFKLP